MSMTRRRRVTLVIFCVIGVIICRGIGKPPDESSGGPTAGPAVAASDSTRRAAVPGLARADSTAGPPDRLTFDSLPETARIALRFDVRPFRRYRMDEYDQKVRKAYPFSADDGLFVARANLQGIGRTDYVVAGRNGGRRVVLAVMRRTDGGGWTVQNVTAGEIGSRAPADSASLWIGHSEKGHPNGKWDAVVVKRLYAQSDASQELYYWDSERKVFFPRKGSR